MENSREGVLLHVFFVGSCISLWPMIFFIFMLLFLYKC